MSVIRKYLLTQFKINYMKSLLTSIPTKVHSNNVFQTSTTEIGGDLVLPNRFEKMLMKPLLKLKSWPPYLLLSLKRRCLLPQKSRPQLHAVLWQEIMLKCQMGSQAKSSKQIWGRLFDCLISRDQTFKYLSAVLMEDDHWDSLPGFQILTSWDSDGRQWFHWAVLKLKKQYLPGILLHLPRVLESSRTMKYSRRHLPKT